jgi:hypothetical protein
MHFNKFTNIDNNNNNHKCCNAESIDSSSVSIIITSSKQCHHHAKAYKRTSAVHKSTKSQLRKQSDHTQHLQEVSTTSQPIAYIVIYQEKTVTRQSSDNDKNGSGPFY